MIRYWTSMKLLKCPKDQPLLKPLSFSETIEEAVLDLEQYLINDFSDQPVTAHLAKLHSEIGHYFETGNCGQAINRTAASINPTFLQPMTGKWFVHYATSPFHGYLPLPLKELLESRNVKNGVIADYCRSELKKLLTGFRKRIDKVMFYFHPCDALAFCYGDLPYKFDLIDTSNLADFLGLANLLNAASRKLLSDQSMLITEIMAWLNVAPTGAKYVQEILFCPLSLIPTLYGFRLMDNVEFGQEALRCTRTMLSSMPTRLRWKKAISFDHVPLVLTPCLKTTLQRLMGACSVNPSIASGQPVVHETVCTYFSPLTFFYVLGDLIRRGSIQEPSGLMDTFLSTLRPVFRKSFETCRAWMEDRSVWLVQLRIAFCPVQQKLFYQAANRGNMLLRLILVPTTEFQQFFSGSSAAAKFNDLNSTVNHLIDNFEVNLKMKSSGLVEWADISFLLEDRRLLLTHSAIVFTKNGIPVFFTGRLSDRRHKVELFTRPYPWPRENSTSRATAATSESSASQLIGESCEETEDTYTIRFKVLSGGSSKPPSGINDSLKRLKHENTEKSTFFVYTGLKVTGNEELQRWPCRSSHRITVSLEGVNPLTITLPYPLLPDTMKATLRQKDDIVEVVAAKALNDLWPEDVIREQFRWNADTLQPWTDDDALFNHLASQFRFDEITDPTVAMKSPDVLTRVRSLIFNIIPLAMKQKQVLFDLRLEGSNDQEWLLRANLPARTSPRGAPVLLLSALDLRHVQRMQSQGKFNRLRSVREFKKIFSRDVPAKMMTLTLKTNDDAQLFRYILRLNSTKIQPTAWQKKNLPQGGDSPWLATFIRPLYLDGSLFKKDDSSLNYCSYCSKKGSNLKRCGRCKAISYCSMECQRTDWPNHKLECANFAMS